MILKNLSQFDLDIYFMEEALKEAKFALDSDEIPIGGVLVKNNQILFRNHNRTKELQNPLAHTEKLLIEEAIKSGEKYLYDYTLYVTIEPCIMCSGNIIWSRVGRVVFGAFDKKAGTAGSVYNALKDKNFNHTPKVTFGILQEDCSILIKNFFQSKRKK